MAARTSLTALNVFPGLFPRDGRNITFKQMNKLVREHYNFAPTFCWYVPNTIAAILGRDYETGVFDLSDIDVHNGIEHDASFTSTYPHSFGFLICAHLTCTSQDTIHTLCLISPNRRLILSKSCWRQGPVKTAVSPRGTSHASPQRGG